MSKENKKKNKKLKATESSNVNTESESYFKEGELDIEIDDALSNYTTKLKKESKEVDKLVQLLTKTDKRILDGALSKLVKDQKLTSEDLDEYKKVELMDKAYFKIQEMKKQYVESRTEGRDVDIDLLNSLAYPVSKMQCLTDTLVNSLCDFNISQLETIANGKLDLSELVATYIDNSSESENYIENDVIWAEMNKYVC